MTYRPNEPANDCSEEPNLRILRELIENLAGIGSAKAGYLRRFECYDESLAGNLPLLAKAISQAGRAPQIIGRPNDNTSEPYVILALAELNDLLAELLSAHQKNFVPITEKLRQAGGCDPLPLIQMQPWTPNGVLARQVPRIDDGDE